MIMLAGAIRGTRVPRRRKFLEVVMKMVQVLRLGDALDILAAIEDRLFDISCQICTTDNALKNLPIQIPRRPVDSLKQVGRGASLPFLVHQFDGLGFQF